MTNKKSVFEVLSAVDVSTHVKSKGNLTYLSWAWAWGEVAKRYSDANYEIYRNPDTNLPYDFVEGTGYMCYTTVTIEGKSLQMWLPVIDFKNKSILSNATTFDINKTLMRCLTKNVAMHGLGHYIYAGEDLPQPTNVTGKDSLDLGLPPKEKKAKSPSIPTGDPLLDIITLKNGLDKGRTWEQMIPWLKKTYEDLTIEELKTKIDVTT